MGLKEWLLKKLVAKEAGSMWDYLKGKKTYLTGVAAIVYYISAAATHHISWQEATNGVFAAVGAMTIRHGINNG